MRSIVARIASLTVGVKIAAIMAFLMLPIGHLTLLFVQQVRKDIAFSSLEIKGAHALKGLWEALATSTAGSLDTSNRKMAADRAAALRTAAANLKAGAAVETSNTIGAADVATIVSASFRLAQPSTEPDRKQ